MYELEVVSKIPSKKNRYRMGRGNFYKDATASTQEELISFCLLEQKQKKSIKTFEDAVSVEIIFKLCRNDLLNIAQTVCDCLQSSGIVKNDKLISHLMIYWDEDNALKANQTSLIRIESLV